MSAYVILAVQLENGEVVAADVRKLVREQGAPDGEFALDDGQVLDRADLASLVQVNDVFVVKWVGPGQFELGSRCRTKPGPMEFLTSVDERGIPNGDLISLPALH